MTPEKARSVLAHHGYHEAVDGPPLVFALNRLAYTRAGTGGAESAHIREAISALINDPGVDLDATDDTGNSALLEAVRRPDIDFVRELLLCGANPNHPLVSRNQLHPSPDPLIHAAVRIWQSRSDVLDALLGAGIEVDTPDEDGQTALMAAKKSPALLRLLLAAGANPNHQDSRGYTPLMHRSFGIPSEIPQEGLAILLDHGADLERQDIYGRTVLLLAIQYADRNGLGMAYALLDKGADPNAKDKAGLAPIDHAAGLCPKFVRSLIVHGADPHASSPGRSHWAGVVDTTDPEGRGLVEWWVLQEKNRLDAALVPSTTLRQTSARL
jgi:ankyrin repeat protein